MTTLTERAIAAARAADAAAEAADRARRIGARQAARRRMVELVGRVLLEEIAADQVEILEGDSGIPFPMVMLDGHRFEIADGGDGPELHLVRKCASAKCRYGGPVYDTILDLGALGFHLQEPALHPHCYLERCVLEGAPE